VSLKTRDNPALLQSTKKPSIHVYLLKRAPLAFNDTLERHVRHTLKRQSTQMTYNLLDESQLTESYHKHTKSNETLHGRPRPGHQSTGQLRWGQDYVCGLANT